MKLIICSIVLLMSIKIHAMQSPRSDKLVSDSKKESRITSPRSKDNSPTSSSYIEKEKPKKGSDIRMQQTLENFAQKDLTEAELTEKFEKAKNSINRYDKERLLKEILETKMDVASAAKHAAANALFKNCFEKIDITSGNIELLATDAKRLKESKAEMEKQSFEHQMKKLAQQLKSEFLELLKHRQEARKAVIKRICAAHPRRFDLWCDFEADTDVELMRLNQKIIQLIAASNLTDDMKAHDVMSAP